MSLMPSDVDLFLELSKLSASLYECIDRDDDLAPTQYQYDRLRNHKWPRSEHLLRAFGLPANRIGWTVLVNSYGMLNPTRSEARAAHDCQASENATTEYTPVFQVDEVKAPLLGSSQREEVYYVEVDGGYVHKVTRTYTTIR